MTITLHSPRSARRNYAKEMLIIARDHQYHHGGPRPTLRSIWPDFRQQAKRLDRRM